MSEPAEAEAPVERAERIRRALAATVQRMRSEDARRRERLASLPPAERAAREARRRYLFETTVPAWKR